MLVYVEVLVFRCNMYVFIVITVGLLLCRNTKKIRHPTILYHRSGAGAPGVSAAATQSGIESTVPGEVWAIIKASVARCSCCVGARNKGFSDSKRKSFCQPLSNQY